MPKEKVIKLHGAAALQEQEEKEEQKDGIVYAFALELHDDGTIRAVTKYGEFDFDLNRVMDILMKYQRFIEQQSLANNVAARILKVLNEQAMRERVMTKMKGGIIQ